MTRTPRRVGSAQGRPPRRGRRIARMVVLAFAGLIMIDAVVGDRGLLAMQRARRSYADLETRVTQQRAENARLREEARRLRDDPEAIEELARRDLGLIRPGERVFIVKDLPSPTPGDATAHAPSSR